MASSARPYSVMENEELMDLRSQKHVELEGLQHRLKKLRKKFKSGVYDRTVICEQIVRFQNYGGLLIDHIASINGVLAERMAQEAS